MKRHHVIPANRVSLNVDRDHATPPAGRSQPSVPIVTVKGNCTVATSPTGPADTAATCAAVAVVTPRPRPRPTTAPSIRKPHAGFASRV